MSFLKRLRRFLRGRHGEPGDKVALALADRFDIPVCPDCGEVNFLAGPRGGISQNIECVGCEARFNFTPMLGRMERISAPPATSRLQQAMQSASVAAGDFAAVGTALAATGLAADAYAGGLPRTEHGRDLTERMRAGFDLPEGYRIYAKDLDGGIYDWTAIFQEVDRSPFRGTTHEFVEFLWRVEYGRVQRLLNVGSGAGLALVHVLEHLRKRFERGAGGPIASVVYEHENRLFRVLADNRTIATFTALHYVDTAIENARLELESPEIAALQRTVVEMEERVPMIGDVKRKLDLG